MPAGIKSIIDKKGVQQFLSRTCNYVFIITVVYGSTRSNGSIQMYEFSEKASYLIYEAAVRVISTVLKTVMRCGRVTAAAARDIRRRAVNTCRCMYMYMYVHTCT